MNGKKQTKMANLAKTLQDGKLCHPAYKSLRMFRLSNRSKIAHLNVSGLKIGNITKSITLSPSLLSILYHDQCLWLTRSRDTVMQRAYCFCTCPISYCEFFNLWFDFAITVSNWWIILILELKEQICPSTRIITSNSYH